VVQTTQLRDLDDPSVDNGASANETDENGDTLLNFAVYPNHVDVARLLLERGADVNHVDPRGMTALLYAATTDFGDPSMVQLLVKMGANPNAKTKEGLTAVDLARKVRPLVSLHKSSREELIFRLRHPSRSKWPMPATPTTVPLRLRATTSWCSLNPQRQPSSSHGTAGTASVFL